MEVRIEQGGGGGAMGFSKTAAPSWGGLHVPGGPFGVLIMGGGTSLSFLGQER